MPLSVLYEHCSQELCAHAHTQLKIKILMNKDVIEKQEK